MSYRYLITLQPVGDFFFGGEHTFGADEERGEISRYRAVSRRFPTQSALIGALRKALLRESGCMTLHKKGEWVDSPPSHLRNGDSDNYLAAVRLAGREAFSYTAKNDLGILRSVSPVMIRRGERFMLPAPADIDLTPREGTVAANLNGESVVPVLFEDYDPKTGLPEALLDDRGERHGYDALFEAVESVGIKKGRDGQTEEKGFFLKRSYKFKEPSLSFALIVETDEALPFTRTQLELGADRSSFLVRAQPYEDDPLERIARQIPSKPLGRIVALSEALLPAEAAPLCRLILGERVRQRQIVESKNGFKKGKPFFRYEPGAVFYSDEPEALAKLMRDHAATEAGVNHIIEKQGATHV